MLQSRGGRPGRRQPVCTRAALQDIVGVLMFSALPFVTVQALADSDLGKKLKAGPAGTFPCPNSA